MECMQRAYVVNVRTEGAYLGYNWPVYVFRCVEYQSLRPRDFLDFF